jgi:Tfp pilus assembly protein PilX
MKLKNRRGSVLAFVLVIFMVFSIFAMSALHITMTNTKHVKLLRDSTQAYYYAYSGAEIAYAAIFKEEGSNKSIFDTYKNSSKKIGPETIDIDKKGTNDITVEVEFIPEKKLVIITSIGTYNGKSSTVKMSFNTDYPSIKMWE